MIYRCVGGALDGQEIRTLSAPTPSAWYWVTPHGRYLLMPNGTAVHEPMCKECRDTGVTQSIGDREIECWACEEREKRRKECTCP